MQGMRMKLLFGETRSSALSDLIEGSLMLAYNKPKRANEAAVLA